MRKTRAVLAFAAVVLSSLAARADGTADEADLHFRMGAKDFARGDYDGALVHFLHSNRLAPNRNVLFNIATAFEQLKRYADAHRYYLDALIGESDPRAIAAVRAGLARVAGFVAVVVVETDPPGATLYVDRKDLGTQGRSPRTLALPRGRYRVIAELEGHEPQVSALLDLAPGAETSVKLRLPRILGALRATAVGARAVTVRVDDPRAAPACVAPCDLELIPGPHQLYFEAEGFEAEPRPVTVVARGHASAIGLLRQLTGSLVVRADEPNALVTVDGKPSGFTPTVIQGVPSGRRRIRVNLRGYEPVEIEVDIQPNRQAEPDEIKLVPLREVVAVSRYRESADDAPSSLTVISGAELRAFGYPTIAEALRGVRGFSLSNDRAYVSASVRGLGQPDDYGNRLLVLSDGHSLNENISSSSAIGNNARVDLHDVDRIEVVRGPGSLLYGTGALAGVVNLVTRPRDEPSGFHAGFGVYDDAVVHGRAGFHYNYSPDKGLWASVSTAHSEGYDVSVPDVLQADGARKTEVAHGVEAFSSVNTAGRAWWGPATVQWLYQYRDQIVPVGAYGTPFGDAGTRLGDTRMMTELRVEPRLSSTVELLLRAHGDHYDSREHFAAAKPTSPALEDYAGTWYGVEARVVVTPAPWLRLTGGGELQHDPQASMTGVYLSPDGAPSSGYLAEQHPYYFGALYALVEGSPKPWLRALAGARVDVYSTVGPVLVPRATLVVKPVTGGVLKLMAGRAFRAPSVYEEFYNAPNFQNPAVDPKRGLTLRPESISSGEVEYSQRFRADWVALVAGYVSEVQGLIDTIADGPGLVRYANSPDPALLAGADVEIRRELRGGWMLAASYGYERSTLMASGAPRLVNAPEHLAAFKGIVPVVHDLASLALRLTVEAPRRITYDSSNTTSAALVADATVSGSLRRFGLHYTVGVYNIADWRYQVPVSTTFQSPTMTQNGRTFLVDLTATYP